VRPEAAVDVVIPTRNTREVTVRCLDSLLGSSLARTTSLRCIVVDNGSSDGTSDVINSRWPEVVVVRNETNAGFGTACNQGARCGRAEFILLLNSDVYARPGAVERLVDFMLAHRSCVAVGGRLVDVGTGRTQLGFVLRGFPTAVAQIALLVGLERVWPTNPISRRQLMLDFDYDRTQEVDAQPAGACLLCRRSDFEAIGGFDEDFYYWFEDVDLVKRLRPRGRVGYVHDAVFEHAGGSTFAQWRRPEVIVSRYESLFRYFSKHHSYLESLTLRATAGTLAVARAIPLAFVDPARARAYAAVVRLAVRPAQLRSRSSAARKPERGGSSIERR
jgi:N-acetylglucosaminyl-diphospho-decaprenol L-rhamnosyltransferase